MNLKQFYNLILAFPTIKCVAELPLEEARMSSIATYNFKDNIIWLTHRHRWLIFHELGHWWAFQREGFSHWLNDWLDRSLPEKLVIYTEEIEEEYEL